MKQIVWGTKHFTIFYEDSRRVYRLFSSMTPDITNSSEDRYILELSGYQGYSL